FSKPLPAKYCLIYRQYCTKDHRKYFLNLLGEISDIYGIEIHAYCLMSNHYHLLIHTPRANISDAMRHLNSRYTQHVNNSMDRDGSLFRGRYKAIIVSAEDYLLSVSRYIHRNPIEAKIVKNLTSYKWSSYPAYLN